MTRKDRLRRKNEMGIHDLPSIGSDLRAQTHNYRDTVAATVFLLAPTDEEEKIVLRAQVAWPEEAEKPTVRLEISPDVNVKFIPYH